MTTEKVKGILPKVFGAMFALALMLTVSVSLTACGESSGSSGSSSASGGDKLTQQDYIDFKADVDSLFNGKASCEADFFKKSSNEYGGNSCAKFYTDLINAKALQKDPYLKNALSSEVDRANIFIKNVANSSLTDTMSYINSVADAVVKTLGDAPENCLYDTEYDYSSDETKVDTIINSITPPNDIAKITQSRFNTQDNREKNTYRPELFPYSACDVEGQESVDSIISAMQYDVVHVYFYLGVDANPPSNRPFVLKLRSNTSTPGTIVKNGAEIYEYITDKAQGVSSDSTSK